MSSKNRTVPDYTLKELADLLAGDVWKGKDANSLPLDEAGWQGLVSLADRHMVLAALGNATLNLVSNKEQLPDGLTEFFEAKVVENSERNKRMKQELENIVPALNGAGIVPLVMKGANQFYDDLYPTIGWRVIGDLDLLVAPDEVEAARKACASIGYFQDEEDSEFVDYHQIPKMRTDDSISSVEIHHRACIKLFEKYLTAEMLLEGSKQVEHKNLKFRVPSAAAQFHHAVIHEFYMHGTYRNHGMSMRNMIEIAAMFRRATGPDREAMVSLCRGYPSKCRAYLAIIFSLFDIEPGFDLKPSARWLALHRYQQGSPLRRRLVRQLGNRARDIEKALSTRQRVGHLAKRAFSKDFWRNQSTKLKN